MEAKLKVITIGDYNISILRNYFKDNENIEFLKLALDESIDNLNTNFSKRDIVFLRTNTEDLEKLLEAGKALKEKEIITLTILEEKIIMENRKVLEETVNAIFPATKKDDTDNLLLELIRMIDNIIFERCYINLDVEDVKNMLKDSGITVFGRLNINKTISKEDIIKNINYPFYPKTLKDSKKLLIFLDTLKGFILTEGELITDILKNETSQNIEDMLFSIRIGNNLKNRIECYFIASKFVEE
ncbi:FtsZ/tubulin family protein [Fusobacterium pseudoperiodonticum]|uniref:Cell division protein FtsZ n=1 Tax=Fusobacterium pseudoperiodonticum TaxID=2663009 RepID=A0A2D3NUJ2_9FUSO|nr:cell division protein FtsZ [Fusobacterium pseudoperiodonticum]ATV59020.1 cell division protein FtsZ [Fusobacterium pseudoperiodonticum]